MHTELKWFLIGFATCFILWFLYDCTLYSFNKNDEKAIVTINTTDEINGFDFEIDNYIKGKHNDFDLHGYTDAYIEYYEENIKSKGVENYQ